jgi:hypothetical protein
MPSFNFKPEFAPMILAGNKVQTIRRSKRCAAGDMMHLFTGLRTKLCVRIKDVKCALVDYVHLAPDGITFGNKANHPDCDGFARLDGFRDFDDMLAWFQRQYGDRRFIGYVHRWVSL